MISESVVRFVLIAGALIGSIFLISTGQVLLGSMIHLLLVAWLLVGTLDPSSRLFGMIQTRCEKGIWLTLDDGPDPATTPAILDLLDLHGAKATFFVIGKKAESHPELIEEIQRRGHQVGNHTYSHPQATFWCHGPFRTYREIARCQEVLEKIMGETPKIFRAPVGHHNVFVDPILRHFHMRLIGWDSRGFDAAGGARLESIAAKIRATASAGSIVLAHEATPFATEVVSDILTMARENGWAVSLPDASPES